MSEIIFLPPYVLTREFWRRFAAPSPESLGRSIMSLLVIAESLVCVFWIFTLSSLGDGYVVIAAVPYIYLIISYVSLFLFYRFKRYEYFTFTQLVMLLLMPFVMQWVIGGFAASSGVAIWAILSPVGALMILGTRQSTAWFLLFVGLAFISWKLNHYFAGNAMPIPSNVKDAFFLMNITGTASILYGVLRYFQAQKERVMISLELEQARSEKLLLNILPAPIAERLKANDIRIADHYDSVTVMFADLIHFTQLSEKMPPLQLIDLLSQVFLRFDQLAEKYQVEKIKTIGDAYMVVSGAPVACVDHAHRIAEMAFDMKIALQEVAVKTGLDLNMRIGIHTGPVVAGVIGSAKFSYDLWGDTVNLASRMESTSKPNTIQISQETQRLIKDSYIFSDQYSVDVKGKGLVETYALLARKE
ncbi:MAG: adenylate/guanylate cyclase domain-containing protein [Methylotenera sp.]|uniref:adenylate/guanylate cyclase domain-containing protein n=1 Tax=Methylotenera sp. TaxID=2051956 RepID=UPI00180F1FCB|nr:adenylate/guanylate cyclase domain-containing protein [Methylotenera sp.]NOU24673.1 adenylate/guanylate cyclase domain-containing protein [Methylotenera sp.]